MKTWNKYVLLILAMAAPLFAHASDGHEIGNGGGAWVCQNSDSLGTIRWAKLVDLYEGRTEFGLTIPEISGRDYLEIVDMIMVKRLFAVSEDLYREINVELERIKSSLMMVDADLEIVDDALYRIKPSRKECAQGAIVYVQLANYTRYGKILVQKNAFEDPRLSETDKAALLVHEAVYAYLRKQMADKDSVRARRIVGLLFSTLSVDDLKNEIEKTMDTGFEGSEMKFVKVKAGSFMMGSPKNEVGRYADEKPHLVQITKSFEIQITALTQKQWFDVMGNNPSAFINPEHCPKTHVIIKGIAMCPLNPVESISYDDSMKFLVVKNAKLGLDCGEQSTPSGFERARTTRGCYRLPTEAEWEYAARSGTTTAYSFGNDSSQLPFYAWFGKPWESGHTLEVAQLKPNNLGLYDMHGNVYQWVHDWYGPYDSESSIDPVGPPNGSYRVFRGGGWYVSAQYLRSANRGYGFPDYHYSNVGFRLARTL